MDRPAKKSCVDCHQSAKSVSNRTFLDCTEPLCCLKVRDRAPLRQRPQRLHSVHAAQLSRWLADARCASPLAVRILPLWRGCRDRVRTSLRELKATTKSTDFVTGAWSTTTTGRSHTGSAVASSALAAKDSAFPRSGAVCAERARARLLQALTACNSLRRCSAVSAQASAKTCDT
jgi:hypothetical protein